MKYLQSAFNVVCNQAKAPEGAWLCLMEESQRYGGPEEGGWWATDVTLVAYQWCITAEEAEAKKAEVEQLAAQLQAESQQRHGEQCLREMDWLEARGLDADWLPEPDGPSRFLVCVCAELPSNSFGPTHYE